jgi:hypothetical protein
MTDISESGIEAALLPCPFCGTACEVREVGHGRAAFKKIEHGTPGDDDKDGWKCPAIGWRVVYDGPKDLAAWNRRHPPASREEGLSDALTKVRDAILSPINSSAIVDTVWMPVPGATFSIETLVDFIDAALQSKKPE